MDEIDIYKAMDNLVKIKKQEDTSSLANSSLAAKAGQGSKEANRIIKRQIEDLNADQKRESHLSETKETLKEHKGESKGLLSPEELKKIVESV